MIDNYIALEKITPNKKQIKLLFELLNSRKFSISHISKPSFKDHKNFVLSNPYRRWYIVKIKKLYIGTVYIQYDNSIGLNFTKKTNILIIKSLLNLIIKNIKPLKEKPSARYKNFFINTPFKNKNLQNILIKLGYIQSQISFIIKK